MSNTRKLKIGFIGAGNIARGGHLNHLSRWDDVDLVAFSDFVLFARAFGGIAPTFDLDGNGRVAFSDFVPFAGFYGWTA